MWSNKKWYNEYFLLLFALEIYTKMIDKNDMECLLKGAKWINIEYYIRLYIFPCNKENQGLLEKENIYKTYTYNSHFATIASVDENEDFLKLDENK